VTCHPGKSRENYEIQDYELMMANPEGYLIPDTIGSMVENQQDLSKELPAKNHSMGFVDRMGRDQLLRYYRDQHV